MSHKRARTPTGARLNDGAAGVRRGGLDYRSLPQSPVDLPLRLDDAGASPTTPQDPQQQAADIKKREKELGFGQGRDEATGANMVRQRSWAREHSLVRQ